jgi:hypothetical protein
MINGKICQDCVHYGGEKRAVMVIRSSSGSGSAGNTFVDFLCLKALKELKDVFHPVFGMTLSEVSYDRLRNACWNKNREGNCRDFSDKEHREGQHD